MNSVFASVPDLQNNPSWSCRIWVRNALNALSAAGLGKYFKKSTWEEVENISVWYAQRKREEARYGDENEITFEVIPTYDLIQKKETQI